MQVFEKATELTQEILQLRKNNYQIGFVPTMGSLHTGHLSLVKHAVAENDFVVVSIFVNPTQFNNPDDLSSYPRNTEGDLQLLSETSCHAVFVPSVEEIYPDGARSKNIDLQGIDRPMEGHFRPGHFEGVATVVSRLFEIVRPHRAYFGEKDFQQLMVIRQMVKNENSNIEIIGHPVERNEAGLALSSRNLLLSQRDRELASVIWKNIHWAQENFQNHTPAQVEEHITKNLKRNGLQVEYVISADEKNLSQVSSWKDATHVRLFVAAYLSGVRLIDNVSLF